jgi:hypothetical protein
MMSLVSESCYILHIVFGTVVSDCGFTSVGSVPKVQPSENRGLTNHTDGSAADVLY